MRKVHKAISVIVGASLTAMVWTGSAWAQAWVQIEAKSSLAQAEERARDWAGMFPDASGFRLKSGWYAIALGPFADEQTADDRRRALRQDGLIPRDSFVADGGQFTQQFWPIGASLSGAPIRPVETQPLPDTAPALGAAEVPAPPAAEPATPAQPAPETLADSRRLESALSRDQRRDIQAALDWEGSYQGAIDGLFGPGTRSSIADWQMKNGFEPTGVLSSAQQMELLDRVAASRAALGLQTVDETEAGISIELPLGLVQFARYNTPFVNYAPKNDSGVQVLLISQPGDAARLRGLYDAMQTLEIVPVSGDRTLRNNGFTIEGGNSEIQSYTQATLSKGLIKGFVLVWPAGDTKRMGRVLEAMKSSFKPIGTAALDATLGQPMSVTRAALMAGIEKRTPVFSRSGFYIDAKGSVLTAAQGLAQCGRITVDAHPADLAFNDAQMGFAVLQPSAPLAPKGFAQFSTQAPLAGAQITVAGFSYPEALPAPVLNFGTLSALKGLAGETDQARIEAKTRAGDVGGPILDGTGAVMGMLLPPAQDAGRMLPDGLHAALQAQAMAPALSQNGFPPEAASFSGPRAAEDLQQIADRMVVRVSCWK
ncbi:trypsin-like peptidase domain-containing protein [Thioclava sp. 15-R06ZXC-3]|uniref:Trypsin-like peptidase domain-containing protein n=1 Tax=Thioclava arctica TaxID=3238301 RepID=A0ABV3TM00_9RHOB